MDQVRVRLHLLPSHHHQPVISRLVQEHRLIVNVQGEVLSSVEIRLNTKSQHGGHSD